MIVTSRNPSSVLLWAEGASRRSPSRGTGSLG